MPDPAPDPLLNAIFADKYRVLRAIGSGGMGTVYQAQHVEIGKQVAIKLLHEHVANAPSMRERFMREARASASIESPHICQVFDVGRLDDGRPFLVMELLRGESLFQRLRRVRRMGPEMVVPIVGQICRGLGKAHSLGAIHRDLKPENIFLADTQDGEELAKVLDFGLVGFFTAKARLDNHRLTRDGTLFGTPLYMCPEQVEGILDLDPRADLWALACIVFECLTGRTVWDEQRGLGMVLAQIVTGPAPIPSVVEPRLPPSFDRWFARSTALDRNQRFSDAQTFALELAEAFDADVRPWLGSTGAVRLPPHQVVIQPPDSRTAFAPHPDANGASCAPTERPPSQGTLTSIERATRRSQHATRLPVFATVAAVSVFLTGSLYAARLVLFPSDDASAVAAEANEAVAAIATTEPALRSEAAAASAAPVTTPCAQAIRRGQRAIAQGQLQSAADLFERAAKRARCEPARTMLLHTQLSLASTGSCRLTGLARPRPIEEASPARHNAIIALSRSAIASWTDEAGSANRLAGVRFDSTLSPGPSVAFASSSRIGDAAAYTDVAGAILFHVAEHEHSTELRAQRVDLLGNPLGETKRLLEQSAAKPGGYAPIDANGGLLVYSAPTDGASSNLFVRTLDNHLVLGESETQLTAFVGSYGPVGPRVEDPAVAVDSNHLVIAYRLERGERHEILLQRVATSEPAIKSPGARLDDDAVLGSTQRLTKTNWRVHTPSIACGAGSCMITWRGKPRGATVVNIETATGRESWRDVVSPRSENVSVGMTPTGEGIVVWYEDGKLWATPSDQGHLGAKSVIAVAQGEQHRPAVQWTGKEWLVAWTTFEQGHPEPYVARLSCKAED